MLLAVSFSGTLRPPQNAQCHSVASPQLAAAARGPRASAILTAGIFEAHPLSGPAAAFNSPPSPLDAAPPLASDYVLTGRKVGCGSFAEVLEVLCRRTGERFAAKKLPRFSRTRLPCHQTQLVAAEASIQGTLSTASTSILQLRDVRQDDSFWYLISELWDFDLRHYLRQHQPLLEREAAHIIRQLLTALATCHRHGVAFADVKPANVLLRSAGDGIQCCLADFGCAHSMLGPQPLNRGSPGTPLYSAPECVHGINSPESDMWATGIMLYEMLSRGFPFCDPSSKIKQSEYWRLVEHSPISYSGPVWHGVSPAAVELVQGMLQRDRSKRLTAAEALQHPWLLDDGVIKQRAVPTSAAQAPSSSNEPGRVQPAGGADHLVGNVVPRPPSAVLPLTA